MKFETVAEAFNYYRNLDIKDMQKRAEEIGGKIDNDPKADISSLNIELKGIKEAKENAETRSQMKTNLKFIDGANMNQGENLTAENVLDSKEYRTAFYKNLLGQKMDEQEKRAFSLGLEVSEKRTDAYNTSGDSGTTAVLPTSTLNEIVKKARTMGGLMAECRAFNMPTKVSIPVATPGTAASWHTEGSKVDSEKASLAAVSFDGYEIIKVFSISAKVRRMSIPAFESYLVEELTACVMSTIEAALVNGTGSGQGTGLESGITWGAGNKKEIGKSASFTYADVVDTVALLGRGYAQGAKWAMNNKTLYSVFYGMTDENGRPVFISDPKEENIGKLLGFEVVIDDNIADNTAYFGNYSRYLGYNLPEGVLVEASRESSFKEGLIDYRALAIADTKPIVTEAFVKLCKAAA